MNKTWMPVVAGTLDIICSVFHILVVFGLTIAIVATGGGMRFDGALIPGAYGGLGNVTALLLSIAIPFAAAAALSMVGGIYALERKKWGWALAGSIAAFFPIGLIGTAAIVLTALSKDEFES